VSDLANGWENIINFAKGANVTDLDGRPLSLEDERNYQRLKAAMGLDFAPGSLHALEMISYWMKGTKRVTMYLLKDDWDEQTAVDIDGEFDVAFFVGSDLKSYVPKDKWARVPEPFRNLTYWKKEQYSEMFGTHGVPDMEYVTKYFFTPMKWDGRPVQRIYFNTETRKIYLKCKPRNPSADPRERAV
jgi:hypothetical protein